VREVKLIFVGYESSIWTNVTRNNGSDASKTIRGISFCRVGWQQHEVLLELSV
jgi:hypothetical protein